MMYAYFVLFYICTSLLNVTSITVAHLHDLCEEVNAIACRYLVFSLLTLP